MIKQGPFITQMKSSMCDADTGFSRIWRETGRKLSTSASLGYILDANGREEHIAMECGSKVFFLDGSSSR